MNEATTTKTDTQGQVEKTREQRVAEVQVKRPNPTSGGEYVRNGDGSLTRTDEPFKAQRGKSAPKDAPPQVAPPMTGPEAELATAADAPVTGSADMRPARARRASETPAAE